MFTGWIEVALLQRSSYLPWLVGVVVAASVAAGAALVALAVFPEWRLRGRVAVAALAVATVGFLAAPAAWSESTLKVPVNGTFPGAGPTYLSAGGFGGAGDGPGGGVFGGSGSELTSALAYVEAHGAAKRFPLIVTSEQEAASYVIAGDRIASMGGFTGRETVLKNAYLSSLVRKGEARYFLLGGQGGFGPGAGASSNAAVTTIASICTRVSAASTGATLYDCAGKADAIAAAG